MVRENENELCKSKDMDVFVSSRAIRIWAQILKQNRIVAYVSRER
jgi:hypothetical protein